MNKIKKQISEYEKILNPVRKIGLILLLLFFISSIAKIKETNSSFSDTAKIEGISFSAGSWPAGGADVVINEVMWMGSFEDENDEWIELRNMDDEEADISGWRILNGGAGSGPGSHLQIPDGYKIKANGYFLITRKKWDKTEINLAKDFEKDEGMANAAGMNLKSGGEKLTLEDKEGNAVDTAWKDKHYWPDGWHGIFLHMSMERDDNPGEGDSPSSWHTCLDGKCNSKEYWKHEGFNFGTPGKNNLSKGNRSLDDFGNSEEKILDAIIKDIGVLNENENPKAPELEIDIPEMPVSNAITLPAVSADVPAEVEAGEPSEGEEALKEETVEPKEGAENEQKTP